VPFFLGGVFSELKIPDQNLGATSQNPENRAPFSVKRAKKVYCEALGCITRIVFTALLPLLLYFAVPRALYGVPHNIIRMVPSSAQPRRSVE
jgi:hypothetical protein